MSDFIKESEDKNGIVRVSEYYEKNGVTYARYKCHCGNIWETRTFNIRYNNIKSCGCSKVGHTTHGMSHTRVYTLWQAMFDRCENSNNIYYYNYGNRGIKVCEEWRYFENFYADMGECPEGMSLDRIDVNGNYCKDNCRWSTRTEQSRNKRNSVYLTDNNGITKLLVEWAKITGLARSVLYDRRRLGWTDHEIINGRTA